MTEAYFKHWQAIFNTPENGLILFASRRPDVLYKRFLDDFLLATQATFPGLKTMTYRIGRGWVMGRRFVYEAYAHETDAQRLRGSRFDLAFVQNNVEFSPGYAPFIAMLESRMQRTNPDNIIYI